MLTFGEVMTRALTWESAHGVKPTKVFLSPGAAKQIKDEVSVHGLTPFDPSIHAVSRVAGLDWHEDVTLGHHAVRFEA